MSALNKPHMDEWYKKEFLITMQNKGKLPRYVNESNERTVRGVQSKCMDCCVTRLHLPGLTVGTRRNTAQEKVNETVKRIFPGPGGIHTTLDNMLDASEKRIEHAHKLEPTAALMPSMPDVLIKKEQRKELKVSQ